MGLVKTRQCKTLRIRSSFLDKVTTSRYTVRGRGAKHFFPSGSELGPTFSLIRSRTSLPEQLDFRQYPGMKSRQIKHFVFQNVRKKSHIWWSKKGPWTDRSQSLTSLTAIHFLDRSKSKAQTTGRQKPRATLQIPLAEINYSWHGEEERTSVFLHYRTERALRAKILGNL